MTRSRRNRLLTLLIALFSLLFVQLAVAGYACPGGTTVVKAGVPCAETMSMSVLMDDEQPSLCQAHCKAQQQATDTFQLPTLATLPDLGVGLKPARAPSLPQGVPVQATLLLRTTAPPLAVRNCCFRI